VTRSYRQGSVHRVVTRSYRQGSVHRVVTRSWSGKIPKKKKANISKCVSIVVFSTVGVVREKIDRNRNTKHFNLYLGCMCYVYVLCTVM
jgi:hypothetical protein